VPNKCLNEPPKHTDHESLVIVYIDNAKFLEAISNKKRSDNSGIKYYSMAHIQQRKFSSIPLP